MKRFGVILTVCFICLLGCCVMGSTVSEASSISVSAVRKQCSTEKKAFKHMTKVSFKTWCISGNKKVTKVRSIYVNKLIAKKTVKIFNQIYNGKEKFPINDIGGYTWRGSTSSLHSLGLAIDINSNENYMIDHGKVLCGSFWKPGKNPYSIPKHGDVMKAMNKNGLKQCIWGSRKDYMHFSIGGL